MKGIHHNLVTLKPLKIKFSIVINDWTDIEFKGDKESYRTTVNVVHSLVFDQLLAFVAQGFIQMLFVLLQKSFVH